MLHFFAASLTTHLRPLTIMCVAGRQAVQVGEAGRQADGQARLVACGKCVGNSVCRVPTPTTVHGNLCAHLVT